MHSVTLKGQPLSPYFNPKSYQSIPRNQNPPRSQFKSLKCCYPNSNPSLIKPLNQSAIRSKPTSQINPIVKTQFTNRPNLSPSLTKPSSRINRIVETQIPNHPKLIPKLTEHTSQISKIQFLSSEFRALPEPIDRVKRLLHYAALLPPLDDTGRVESNRVTGCTTQVWLEAKMDSQGLMRFRADSDSEITKGFCYCLVWALDGVEPEEVMAVVADDLAEMNVGFSGRSLHSRVNTWQNVLVGMQRRTMDLAEEREIRERLEGFPSLGGRRTRERLGAFAKTEVS